MRYPKLCTEETNTGEKQIIQTRHGKKEHEGTESVPAQPEHLQFDGECVELHLVTVVDVTESGTEGTSSPWSRGCSLVDWPPNVDRFYSSKNPSKVVFKDFNDTNKSRCEQDCYIDICKTSMLGVLSTPDTCKCCDERTR